MDKSAAKNKPAAPSPALGLLRQKSPFLINLSLLLSIHDNTTQQATAKFIGYTEWIYYKQCAKKAHEAAATNFPGKMFKTTRIAKTTSVTPSWHPSADGRKAKI